MLVQTSRPDRSGLSSTRRTCGPFPGLCVRGMMPCIQRNGSSSHAGGKMYAIVYDDFDPGPVRSKCSMSIHPVSHPGEIPYWTLVGDETEIVDVPDLRAALNLAVSRIVDDRDSLQFDIPSWPPGSDDVN